MEHAHSRPRWAAALAGTMITATALHFWTRNVADPDLWGHLTWGRQILRDHAAPQLDVYSYTAAGQPFYCHHWLFDALVALLLGRGGPAALVAMKLTMGTLVLLAMLDAARTTARATGCGRLHPFTLAAAFLLGLAVIAPGATFRPQLFTMALTALEWALLSRADLRLRSPGRRRIGPELLLVPVVLCLWANLHGGFLVGVGMLGVYAASIVVEAAWPARTPGGPTPADAAAVAAVALLGILAPLLNPYGPRLYLYLARTLDMHGRIIEWLPVPLGGTHFLRFKLLALAALGGTLVTAALVPTARRALAWRSVFLALALVYALRHQRHTVLFAIVATPALAAAVEALRGRLAARWPRLAPRPPVLALAGGGMLALAVVQLAGVAAELRHHGLDIRYTAASYPAAAVAFLREHGIRGNVAMPFDWGSYTLEKLGDDGVRVFIDGRLETTFPARVIDDYFAFVDGAPGWERLLDAYPTDVVAVARHQNVHPRLFARPDFVYVYSDPVALVFVRRGPRNAAALERLAALPTRPPPPATASLFP